MLLAFSDYNALEITAWRLSGVAVTCDREVVGSTRGGVKWLLLGWMTVCRKINHLGI